MLLLLIRRTLFCTLLLGFAALSTRSVQAESYSFEFQRVYELTRPVTLQLSLEVGSVEVVGTESSTLIIDATKRISAPNEQEAATVASYIEIKTAHAGKSVTVATNYLRIPYRGQSFWQRVLGWGDDSYGSVHYRIQLPIGCSVAIDGLDVEVKLSSIQGSVSVQLAAGATQGEFIFGPVSIRQPVGSISLESIEGDIRIKSSKSPVSIGQTVGSLDITTSTGNITIMSELITGRESRVETTTGSILFMVPPSASAMFRISSETGEIVSDLPLAIRSLAQNRLVGTIGDGGEPVSLQSATGDVTVRYY